MLGKVACGMSLVSNQDVVMCCGERSCINGRCKWRRARNGFGVLTFVERDACTLVRQTCLICSSAESGWSTEILRKKIVPHVVHLDQLLLPGQPKVL